MDCVPLPQTSPPKRHASQVASPLTHPAPPNLQGMSAPSAHSQRHTGGSAAPPLCCTAPGSDPAAAAVAPSAAASGRQHRSHSPRVSAAVVLLLPSSDSCCSCRIQIGRQSWGTRHMRNTKRKQHSHTTDPGKVRWGQGLTYGTKEQTILHMRHPHTLSFGRTCSSLVGW